MAEKEVEDIFREEWVEEPRETMFTDDLVAAVVLVVMVEVLAARGGGYSGGGSGDNIAEACGGGGESFYVGTDQQNECGYNKASHGQCKDCEYF